MSIDTTRLVEVTRSLRAELAAGMNPSDIPLTPENVAAAKVIYKETKREVAELTEKYEQAKFEYDIADKIVKSSDKLIPPFVLQRNDCSRLHKFIEACKAGRCVREPVYNEDNIKFLKAGWDNEGADRSNLKVFVVQHDWAALIPKSSDDEIMLPAPESVFEFRVNGVTCMVLGNPGAWGTAIDIGGDHWMMSDVVSSINPVTQFIVDQAKAVCISLDAEVSTHSVIRAPEKLNKKRTANGALPLYDFHMVDLSKRHRAATAPGTGTHRSPRLHFRRGHWRHFENHKTWIKWMLVGDPDLGFVDKQYKI